MKSLKKLLCILLALAALLNYCCCQKDSSEAIKDNLQIWEPSENSVSPLEIVNRRDTLIIIFEGTECGEWGGHKETIFLHRQNNNEITARILIDTVPCDDIIEQKGVGILNPEKRIIVVDATKVLELKDEQLISEFLQRLLELYLKPLLVGNYGSFYVVRNTNNSLYFKYWNSGNVMDTHYGTLKKEVFGDLK